MKRNLLNYSVFIVTVVILMNCGNLDSKIKKAKAGDADAIADLVEIMTKSAKSEDRAKGASALGEAAVKSAYTQVVERFENDDDIVRIACIKAIGQIGVGDARQRVLKAYRDKNSSAGLKMQALEGLTYISHPDSFNAMKVALNSGNPSIENIAIQGFGRQKSKKSVGLLLNKLKRDRDVFIIYESLEKINDHKMEKPLINILSKRIDEYSFDKTSTIKTIEILRALKSKASQPVLVKLYLTLDSDSNDNNEDIRDEIEENLKELHVKNKYGLITASSLNMREKTNIRSNIVGNLVAGTLVTIIEKSNVKNSIQGQEDYWYKVKSAGNKPGWMFGGFMTIFDPEKL